MQAFRYRLQTLNSPLLKVGYVCSFVIFFGAHRHHHRRRRVYMVCTPISLFAVSYLFVFFLVSMNSLFQRRDTCEPGMFEGIVGDLESSPGSTPASASSAVNGGGSRIGGHQDEDVPTQANTALPESASPSAPNSR